MNFDGFVGNDEVKERLNKLTSSKRLPHALIIQGADGLGKHTLAKKIAAYLTCKCEDESLRPCGRCKACTEMRAGSHPDVRSIAPLGSAKTVNVAQIRDSVVLDCYEKPIEADYNIYLLESGKAFTPQVQNTLLKVIEEPPEGGEFIMLVSSAESMLTTIRSRAVTLTLRAPKKDEAISACRKVHPEIEEEKLEEAAKLFNNNIGRMLDFLSANDEKSAKKSKKNSSLAFETASAIARNIDAREPRILLEKSFPLIDDRALFTETLDMLEEIFRDACVIKAGGDGLISTDPEAAAKIADSRTKKRIVGLPEICSKYRKMCDGNGNMKLIVTSLCARLRE